MSEIKPSSIKNQARLAVSTAAAPLTAPLRTKSIATTPPIGGGGGGGGSGGGVGGADDSVGGGGEVVLTPVAVALFVRVLT